MLKKIILLLALLLVLSAPIFAENLLPYFEFDFNKYIDNYHQLIINDVYFDEVDKPYFNTLNTVLKMFSSTFTEDELIEQIKKQDGEGLKNYISSLTQNGTIKSDKEIESFIFNKDNMYSAFISPTTDSAMSYFGHNFLMFYIPEAPMLSPCINFFAHYEHLSALGTVFEGLVGNLVSYYDFQPFFVTFLDYTANRDRSIIMYKLNVDTTDNKVCSTMADLKYNDYPNYSFLFYNCSHGFFTILEDIDSSLTFNKNRAFSPASGMKAFDDRSLVSEAKFEFPAWNDLVNQKSPKQYKNFYKHIKSGKVGFRAEKPFRNIKCTREVANRKAYVSSRFSSLSFNYGLNDKLEHNLNLWFKPVFNDFFEQNYVDHEIMNLHAFSANVSAKVSKNGKFDFEGFKFELFSFDSILPFTTLQKRLSLGANLSLGMKDYRFLAEAELYTGLAFGQSDIFCFVGLDNRATTEKMEYTLNLRAMLGGKIGPFTLLNTTDIVLFSTLYDYFHIENELQFKFKIIDSLAFSGSYKLQTKDGLKTKPQHSGTVSVIYNFNIF